MAVTAERQQLGADAGTAGTGEYITPLPVTRSPYDRFYREFAPRVAGMVRRRVPDEDLVDDIVQETLLRAYRKGLHLERGSEAWRWVATVTRNLCIDARRRRHHWVETSLEQMTHAPVPTTQIDLGDLAAERTEVSKALDAIKPRERRLLVAHHLHDEACRDLAAREGLTDDAVKSALARARAAFREAYASAVGRAAPVVVALGAPLARRVRAVRDRLLARRPPIGSESVASTTTAVKGFTSAVILGAVAVGGPLFQPGEPTPRRPDTVPASTEVKQFGAPVFATGDALPARSEVGADPAARGVADEPEPPPPAPPAPPADRGAPPVAGEAIDTDLPVHVEDVPINEELGDRPGGDVARDVVDVDVDVEVEVDHAVGLDLGVVEAVEDADEGAVGASVSCPSPEERGAATGAACPLAEGRRVGVSTDPRSSPRSPRRWKTHRAHDPYRST